MQNWITTTKNNEKEFDCPCLRNAGTGNDGVCDDGHPDRRCQCPGHNHTAGRTSGVGIRPGRDLRRTAACRGETVPAQEHTAVSGMPDIHRSADIIGGTEL